VVIPSDEGKTYGRPACVAARAGENDNADGDPAGFDVIEAGSATEALSLLDSGRMIDAIFSDVQMPGRINGAGLAEIVQRRFPATRIILTSGSDAGYDLAGSPEVPFIWKPYRAETVIAAVERVLQGFGSGRGEDGLSACR